MRDAERTGAKPVIEARDYRVRGLVQGVGFRPTVWRIASALALCGSVFNDAEGVLVHLEGDRDALERFPGVLLKEKPPLARIDAIEPSPSGVRGDAEFSIAATPAGGIVRTAITADASVCRECLEDMFDPSSRRYRYAFTNCTHCGPRFTITRHLPYDRPQTSMAAFPMCPACRQEYENPSDRRFHAQPVACPVCGPKLSLVLPSGESLPGDPVRECVRLLKAGAVVAVKGLGGFHLACDAENAQAVAALRRRKHRDEKPLAVMAAGIASAERFVRIRPDEAEVLRSPAHPIVLLERRRGPGVPVLAGIADGLDEIGVMLPYTPLHALLFHAAAGEPDGTDWLESAVPFTLVMTSANPGGEPLCTQNAEALERLHGIADVFLLHGRDIVTRCDDSVVRVTDGVLRFVRRSRGYAPEAVRLPEAASGMPAVLAAGPYLKNTGALIRGRDAFLTQHVGSLDNMPTARMLEESLAHLEEIFEISPELAACDAHPDFASTRLAQRIAGERSIPLLPIHHHAAHIGVVAAETGFRGPLFGLALDGTGLGPDGSIWGGEALLADETGFARAGSLMPMRLPGGDRAAKEPWRMGASLLSQAGRTDLIERFFPSEPFAGKMPLLLNSSSLSPITTSLGRWFDGMAALLGLCLRQHDEATAAMRLESAAAEGRRRFGVSVLRNGWTVSESGRLSLSPLVRSIAEARLRPDADVGRLAAEAEDTLAAALLDWTLTLRRRLADCGLLSETNIAVALTGGCLVNRMLARVLSSGLREAGLDPRIPATVPAGDGGLALGQAWLAASACRAGKPAYEWRGELLPVTGQTGPVNE